MAGRIPQSFIDDLLDRTDIVDVIGERLELRRAGSNHKARCPFHDEKTPSFSVNQEQQFYYCFGCNAGGNAIGFVMAYDHIDFIAALEYLAHRAGLEIPRETDTAPATRRNEPLLTLLERAHTWYDAQLQEHPAAAQATNYLKQRGVAAEIAREFGIGFAPPGWDNLIRFLDTKNNASGDSARRDNAHRDNAHRDNPDSTINLMIEAGLAVARESGDGHYDRFRHRIMFPIRDARGRTLGFGGRVLGDDQPKYLNSPETPVFHKGRELYGLYEARTHLRSGAPLLVVEGYMDVVALAQFGIRNAVATLGTAVTDEHIAKLFRHTSDLVFCFDGDAAGRRAASRALDICLPALGDGRAVRFMFLPDGEDPDTLVRRIGSGEFSQLIASAQPLSEFLFATAASELDLALPDDRARFCQRAAPMIHRLPPGVLRQLLLSELATRAGIPASTLEQLTAPRSGSGAGPRAADLPEPRKTSGAAPEPPAPAHRETTSRPGRNYKTPLVHHLLALLLHHPRLCTELAEALESLRGEAVPDLELVFKVYELLQKNPGYTFNHVLSYWHGMHGQEQRNLLAKIAANELLLAPETAAGDHLAEARGIIERLQDLAERDKPAAARLRGLLDRDALSAEDRARIRALILELSTRIPNDPIITEAKQRVMKFL